MAIQPTYPGVYVQEVPSGVRTITGVSTSVTAFVGTAKKGPINRAVNIFSYPGFERRFGGLESTSEMSYAVRQFFLNGGKQAVIVRLVKEAGKASVDLSDSKNRLALKIEALEDGFHGNNIEVSISHKAINRDSNFNLSIRYSPPDNPSEMRVESFPNLSMNEKDSNYVLKKVNGSSGFIQMQRLSDIGAISDEYGKVMSGELEDVGTLLDDRHNRLRIKVNGGEPIDIIINIPTDIAGDNPEERIKTLCEAIQKAVTDAAGRHPHLTGFTCDKGESNQIEMKSGIPGENSKVEILSADRNDASTRLKLGVGNGGRQIDTASHLRPSEVPERGRLKSGFVAPSSSPEDWEPIGTGKSKFRISLDGRVPITVDIAPVPITGANHEEKMKTLAQRIQNAVRSLNSSVESFRNFTCSVEGDSDTERRLVLSSGIRGANSSVVVTAAPEDELASALRLLAGIDGASSEPGTDLTLKNGNEIPFDDSEAYSVYIASRTERKGIYALEETDLFNILCLPGISDGGIIADSESYCKERRAFLLVDPPKEAIEPSDIANLVSGTTLPKSDHAAIYYPWIKVSDPLNSGNLRPIPPSGAIAGLYARTDSSRGVWKAPAGTEANLSGVQQLEYNMTDGENGFLNPMGINCLRAFPTSGVVAWGARTLAGTDDRAHEYKYIPVRRLSLFIQESLYRGTQWAVFEPNDEPLWAQLRLNIGAFMHNLFRKGAFQGSTPKDAYLVKCDSETTTQNDINLGIVNILVGFAPLKPAEFVIIQIQQLAGQIEA